MNLEFVDKFKDQDVLESFTRWTLQYLIRPRLYKNMNVVVRNITTEHRKCGFVGMASMFADKRTFTIEVNSKLSTMNKLKVIAHECTHVKQWRHKEMIDKGATTEFLGKVYIDDETEYWERPWEIEAHGREKGLIQMYIREFDLTGAPWYKEFI